MSVDSRIRARQGAGIRLAWPGREDSRAVPDADLELVREGTPRTLLIHGDNLKAVRALEQRTGPRFALAYLDPPFFTGRVHLRVERSRDKKSGRIVRSTRRAFDDRWTGLDAYLEALAERISAVRELLLPEGCLVLHVDPKTSHYAKVLCDEIFGPRSFASEIVWRYRRWPSKTRNFQRVHDVLLRYVRDPDATPKFRQLYEPLAPSTLQTWGTKKQRAVVDPKGQRVRSSRTEDATLGAPLGDVWDISIVAPVARERTGYPTQKPEALLERLIEACTDPDDLVLDPYAGSGTTLAVCARTGRTGVGIDSSRQAIVVARKRLRAAGIQPLEERVVELDEPRVARTGDVDQRVA
jgi:site-specific DNA-methyltransferase (adenine-specific)